LNPKFGEWIDAQGLAAQTRKTQTGHLTRLERAYGDLDAAYDKDRFESILSTLRYTSKERDSGKANPSAVPYTGKDLYQHLATMRTALGYYTSFRQGWTLADSWPELEQMRTLFVERCPGFTSFAETSGVYFTVEREYKDRILVRAEEILRTTPRPNIEVIGRQFLEIIRTPPANFVNWRTMQLFKGDDDAFKIATTIGSLVCSEDDAALAVEKAANAAYAVMRPNAQQEIFGGVRSLVTTALAFARPDDAISVKTNYMAKAARVLTNESMFRSANVNASEYREFLSLCGRVREHMDRWKWSPRDLWDVQGFLWIVTQEEWNQAGGARQGEQDVPDEMMDTEEAEKSPSYSLNTILYGPPGTGKTYKTAEIAVAICNGNCPDSREKLMDEYRKLIETNRIAFTTFHQSIGYEEFVEGLRPVVGTDDSSGAVSAGFRLEARNGIFREVCAQAEAAIKRTSTGATFDFADRKFYKMSLGQTGIDEDIYEAALKGDYIVLGWGGDEDWSDPKYEDSAAVLARWTELRKEVTANSGDVVQVARFRSMEIGDIVIVPEGNTRFRAIGEVDGDYEFAPGTVGGNHRRKVNWLVKLDESLPLETIYIGKFAQAACYSLSADNVKLPALKEMIGPSVKPGVGAATPYVLIIDEINRANISKVLGELITLLEPDKRLGAENEITLTLPYSKARFGVPKNLYIIGTMNTADRSIAPIDTALRRRFEFVPMMPDYTVLAGMEVGGVQLDTLLKGINDRIEWLFDRDHLLGHAFFVGIETKVELDRVMRKKIVPLLAEYFYEDWAKVRSALNDNDGHFVLEEKLVSPLMETDKEPRMRFRLADGPVAIEAYQSAIGEVNA